MSTIFSIALIFNVIKNKKAFESSEQVFQSGHVERNVCSLKYRPEKGTNHLSNEINF